MSEIKNSNVYSDSEYSSEEEPWEKEHRDMTTDEIMNQIKEWLDEKNELEEENEALVERNEELLINNNELLERNNDLLEENCKLQQEVIEKEKTIKRLMEKQLELIHTLEHLKYEHNKAQQRIKELYKLVYKTDDKNTSITSD